MRLPLDSYSVHALNRLKINQINAYTPQRRTHMKPQISVLFATHNGQSVLTETLEGYCNVDSGNIRWEMIIVNNASTDNTSEILASFSKRIPLKIIDCPTPGKNIALNSAIQSIEGDYVIVTDDDAIPHKSFLSSWLATFETQKDYSLFGATIEPFFLTPAPEWMTSSRFHYEEIYAARNLEDGPIAAANIFGPNMAVRRSVFDSGMQFNEQIGPSSDNKDYPMGSETEFCTRVERAGHKAWFSSSPSVQHIVRPNQITNSYWIKRAYKHGLGYGLQFKLTHTPKPLVRRIISNVINAFKQLILAAQIRTTSEDLAKNNLIWEYHWARGFIKGKEDR